MADKMETLMKEAPSVPAHVSPFNGMLRHARRLVVLVVGVTVLLVGVVMVVLPGPAVVVIPLGLAILATEFVWAARLLKRLKQTVHDVAGKVGPSKPDDAPPRSS